MTPPHPGGIRAQGQYVSRMGDCRGRSQGKGRIALQPTQGSYPRLRELSSCNKVGANGIGRLSFNGRRVTGSFAGWLSVTFPEVSPAVGDEPGVNGATKDEIGEGLSESGLRL